MTGHAHIRRPLVDHFRSMLPPEHRAHHHHDVDDRFAPPGQPPRTELGRWCDLLLARAAHRRQHVSLPDQDTGWPPDVDPASIIIPAGWDLADDRWLTISGVRGHTHHPTVIVVDVADPHARLALVAVAAVVTQHDLRPHHRRTPPRSHEGAA